MTDRRLAGSQLARVLFGSYRTTVPAIQSCSALRSLPVHMSTNEVIRVTKLKMPSMMRPGISRSAMYQKPATRLVSGRQHRIPSTCSAGGDQPGGRLLVHGAARD